MGCPGATRDKPIYARDANLTAGLIAVTQTAPIGYKSHFANQIVRHEREQNINRILLITRNPAEAISSHLARRFSKMIYASSRSIRIAVERELDIYLSLLYAFRSFPVENRCHTRFENLILPERSLSEANKLLRMACSGCAELSMAEWFKVCMTAKNSQVSLKLHEAKVRNRIVDEVNRQFSTGSVDQYLDSGTWTT